MFDPRTELSNTNDSYDRWGDINHSARARKTAPNYENYGNWNGGGVNLRPQNMADESGVCSPPLWNTSPPRSPVHQRPHHNNYRYLSPASRTQAIARGQWELMEMVKKMPESSYELTLRDLVVQPRAEPQEDCLVQKKIFGDEVGVKDRDIHGRIYLNEQGINAQYSGPSKDAFAYVKWLKEDHRFSGILFQVSVASKGHAFPRLKLRYKPSLVQLEGGISHLPLLDPSMRATPLTPSQWRNRLESVNKLDNASDLTTKSVLLDVRNGYEWDVGHFRGAQRPDVGCFRSTSFGLSKSEVIASDPLAGVDKERTDILMYCTGGIRCDVYSAILR
ncbi:unnamed protein product [Ilex paraguariensis]|uniref:Rhodanese domain-containing protein n=1 Tax=Ilex paraguariensis TaxID=185542 RepID=A0ABC8U350_9AQUA